MAPSLQVDRAICEPGSGGAFWLPLFGDAEQRWPRGLRVVLYLLGLAWCFMGVAIIAEIFMAAIERITSKKVRRYSASLGRWYTATVWNPTVANLTLMALGSSAPEILLNVIETVLINNMFSGRLGPSTIVGSAAFNLLVIIAVCVSAIPNDEVRMIKEVPVYYVTAVFSIAAYVWLVIALQVFSPNVVEPWEGLLTFLFFPVLVVIAYLADKGYLTPGPKAAEPRVLVTEAMSREELAELQSGVRREYGAELTDEQVMKIIAVQNEDHATRAHYRVAATRLITGGRRVTVAQRASVQRTSQTSSSVGAGAARLVRMASGQLGGRRSGKVLPVDDQDVPPRPAADDGGAGAAPPPEPRVCMVAFATTHLAVLESAGSVKVKVVRYGSCAGVCKVKYCTRDGSAKASGRQAQEEGGGDYIHAEGHITFEVGEEEKWIEVQILDDNTYEEDEEFFIDLSDAEPVLDPDAKFGAMEVCLGEMNVATIVIIDDDIPGTLGWEQEEVHLQEEPEDFVATFRVQRKNGCKNAISCKYHTENGSAISGKDFESCEGTLDFPNGVTSAVVKVRVLARGRYGTSEMFRVILHDIAEGCGAKFDSNTDGGAECCILTVHIDANQQEMERVDRMMSTLRRTWDKSKIGHESWRDQFVSALYVHGGEEGDDDGPTTLDWAMHVVTLPWKVAFAFCPPTDYCGGWACFFISLVMIGLVTIFIGDLANLFGCVLVMEDEITAITFVALGTSLPDTFASKTAAVQDPFADASVVNVTGSNSVNVFLGLGMPWLVASLYWWFGNSQLETWDSLYQYDPDLAFLGPLGNRRRAYVVKAGALSFSVVVFAGCAVCCLFLLWLRRRLLGGELGGPRGAKHATSGFLVFLWMIYLLMSILKIKGVL